MSFAVVVAGYDKNFWFKCKGCFCFLLYYGMLFIQVFYCNWLQQASPHGCFVSIFVTQTQKAKHCCSCISHSNIPVWQKSWKHKWLVLQRIMSVFKSPVVDELRMGEHPPHLFLPLAVSMAITAQLLMTSAFPFFPTQWNDMEKKINSAEFNFKETTSLFCLNFCQVKGVVVKSQVNLSLKSSSKMHLLPF